MDPPASLASALSVGDVHIDQARAMGGALAQAQIRMYGCGADGAMDTIRGLFGCLNEPLAFRQGVERLEALAAALGEDRSLPFKEALAKRADGGVRLGRRAPGRCVNRGSKRGGSGSSRGCGRR